MLNHAFTSHDRITSYINNLHPKKHRGLSTLIQQLITRAIPLWNITLTPLRERAYRFHRINYDQVVYKDEGQNRKLVQPDVGFFRPPDPETTNCLLDLEPKNSLVNLRTDYAHRGLQAIVRLANIHLTPDKPEYEGRS